MNQQDIRSAAAILWQHWQQSTRFDELPAHCRPGSRAEGYAIQAEVAKLSGQSIVGWKIAATSAAGQQHIRVDGPLAGCLLFWRARLKNGARISLAGKSHEKVAGSGICLPHGQALPKRLKQQRPGGNSPPSPRNPGHRSARLAL